MIFGMHPVWFRWWYATRCWPHQALTIGIAETLINAAWRCMATIAGLTFKTARRSLEDARRRVLEALPGAVRRRLTAGEMMSRPPRFVSPDDTVSHAMVLCQRHRQSGMQVGEPRRLVGMVTDRDIVIRAVAEGGAETKAKAARVRRAEVAAGSRERGEAPVERAAGGRLRRR